jgi:phage FluMu protein Com
MKINNNVNSYKTLPCRKCGRLVETVGEEAVKVTCSWCVLGAVGFPEESKSAYKPTGRPAGWHWMKEFVDKDGSVYHLGKEQPKLKGTKKPTKVVKKTTKRRTKAEIEASKIKKYQMKKKAEKVKLKSEIKKQTDFINHNIDKG